MRKESTRLCTMDINVIIIMNSKLISDAYKIVICFGQLIHHVAGNASLLNAVGAERSKKIIDCFKTLRSGRNDHILEKIFYFNFVPLYLIYNKSEFSFYLQPITTDDFLLEMKRLKHNKPPGHDLIGNKIVKPCPEIFAMNLAKIYNRGIENGKYTDDLKIAKVVALYTRNWSKLRKIQLWHGYGWLLAG